MSNTKYILSLLLASTLTIGFAQKKPTDSTTIISVEEYKPMLTDAFKIKDNPIIKDTTKLTPKLKYSFLNKQVPVSFNVEPIKPAKVKGEPLVKLYRGYAKLGFGTNTTPLAELYYNAKRSKEFGYGFKAKHFSSTGINNNGYSGFSENGLSLFGKRFTKEFTLYGKLGYDRYVNHYYGIPESLNASIVQTGDLKQNIDKFNTNFSLTRNFTDTLEILRIQHILIIILT
jgi:hypothetical protein